MGQSTNGIVAFGYDLGAGEGGWKVEQVGEYGDLKVPWYDSDADEASDDENEDADGSTAVGRLYGVLYESIPDAPEVKWSWDRETAVKERLGVWLESYCSGDYPMYILATYETTVYRGDTKLLDMAALEARRAAEGWDEKLAHALSVLGLTPTQEQPGWLLASYWS